MINNDVRFRWRGSELLNTADRGGISIVSNKVRPRNTIHSSKNKSQIVFHCPWSDHVTNYPKCKLIQSLSPNFNCPKDLPIMPYYSSTLLPSQPFSIMDPMYTLSGASETFHSSHSFLTPIKSRSMFYNVCISSIRFPAGVILSCQTQPSATAGFTGHS